MDYKRKVITSEESDVEYVKRTVGEMHTELTRVYAAINCTSFKPNSASTCEGCKLYRTDDGCMMKHILDTADKIINNIR
jgi:hypothetical protein